MKRIIPSKEEFLLKIASGTLMPLAAELDVPGLTPLSAFESVKTAGYPVLLESARMDDRIGRYSFVTADPYLIFKSRGDAVELVLPETPAGKYGRRATTKRKPLLKLRELLSNYRTARLPGLPPFTGGAVGFFSYDFVHQLETLPRTAVDDLDIPEAYFLFVDVVVAFDHVWNKSWIIVNPGAREQELGFRRPRPDEWEGLYDRAADKLMALSSQLEAKGCSKDFPLSGKSTPRHFCLMPDMTQDRFESMVKQCKEYIAAGDIYQANLSQRLSGAIGDADPIRLYRILRAVNPSPFAAFLDFGDLQLVSSSPERLVRLLCGACPQSASYRQRRR